MSESAVAARRQPSVLLIVSLCLNVALIGLIAIAAMRFQDAFQMKGHKRELSPQALMRIVPAERDKLQTIVDTHRPRLRELRAAAMNAREASLRILASHDFQPEAFERSLAAVEQADAAFQSEIVKETAESVAMLTPQERQAVAQKVRRPGRSWLKRLIRKH